MQSIFIRKLQLVGTFITMSNKKIIRRIFLILKIATFLVLFAIFAIYVKEVFHQFLEGYTNFRTISVSPQHLDSPTLVFCLEPDFKPSVLNYYGVTSRNFLQLNNSKYYNESFEEIFRNVSYTLPVDLNITISNMFCKLFI